MILIDALHDNDPQILIARRLPGSLARTCHMTSDTSYEELVAAGRRLAMPPTWMHGSHFDLSPFKRRAALQIGAVEVSTRELVCRSWDRRLRFAQRGVQPYCICGNCAGIPTKAQQEAPGVLYDHA